AETLGELMSKVMADQPAPLVNVPPPIAQLVEACLRRAPEHRAQSVAHVALGLSAFAPPRARPIVDRIVNLLRPEGSPFSVQTTRVMTPFDGGLLAAAPLPEPQAVPPAAHSTQSSISVTNGSVVAGAPTARSAARTLVP